MKKFLALFLSISLMSSYTLPLAAQTPEEEAEIERKASLVVQAAEENGEEALFQSGVALAKNLCGQQGVECLERAAFEALRAAGGNPEEAVVCDDKQGQCASLLVFGQGAVHFALKHMLYHHQTPVIERADSLVSLITQYGVHSKEDQRLAIDYFQAAVSAAQKDCSGGFFVEYGLSAGRADRRQVRNLKLDRCGKEVAAVYGLAMLAYQGAQGQKAVSTIAKLLDKKYDSQSAGAIIPAGVSGLATIGTPQAYEALEKFLTKTTTPTLVGSLFNTSLEGAAQLVMSGISEMRGSNIRYLNRINAAYQYPDEAEAARQGYAPNTAADLKNQVPQTNLMEDVGVLLGTESAQNVHAKNLAVFLVKKANEYVEKNAQEIKPFYAHNPQAVRAPSKDGFHAASKIHFPLILGILDGWQQNAPALLSNADDALLEFFYKGDWWDINEGTQQRLHYKARQIAAKKGQSWPMPTRDEQKAERYAHNAQILNISQKTDMVLIPVFLVMLVVSIPSIVRNITSAVRMLKTNRKFIGIRLTGRASKTTKAGKKAAAVSAQKPVSATATKTAGKPKPVASSAPQTAAKPTSAKPATQRPATEPLPEVKAPKPEPLSATPRKQIDGDLLGPLDQKVQQAKKIGTPYRERSLMPKSKENVATGPYQARKDGLVYMEAHPNDPSKAVFYYADDMGRVRTAKEVPMSQYDDVVSTMTEAEKAQFNYGADNLYADDLAKMRKDREFDRLESLGKQIRKLEDERQYIIDNQADTYVLGEGGPFERTRQLQHEIDALKKEAERTILDMKANGMGDDYSLNMTLQNAMDKFSDIPAVSPKKELVISDDIQEATRQLENIGGEMKKLREELQRIRNSGQTNPQVMARTREINNQLTALENDGRRAIAIMSKKGMGSEGALWKIFQNAQESYEDTKKVVATATGKHTAYHKRSLTPKASRNASQTQFTPRKDGLVYMEEHATDPSKAVFYYADDMGQISRIEEVPMSHYDDFIDGLSRADKDVLARSAEVYGDAVSAARKEREFERLESLGNQIRDLRTQRQDITGSGVVDRNNLAQASKIDKKIAELQKEAERTIADMASNGMGHEGSLRRIFQTAQESAAPVGNAAPSAARHTAYANRSLMPKSSGSNSRSFTPRKDGLVYMEAHATDPSKAVFYYADDMGQISRIEEVPMSHYDDFIDGLSRADKDVLARSAEVYGDVVSAARKEREFERLENLAHQVRNLKAQQRQIEAGGVVNAQTLAQSRDIQHQISSLVDEANRTIRDMSANGMGKERSLQQLFANWQE
ncbi:hypothetical protein [Candidatus Avelusimicrobium sp.]